jgi:hypothetical protein
MCASNTEPLTPPNREQAEHWMRDLGIVHKLEVVEITPGGERKPIWLHSLLDAVEFLLPAEMGKPGSTPSSVNFVDPARLVAWTRDAIGDPELADRMDEVVATGAGYRFLTPQLGKLALARLLECWELLKAELAEQPPE